MINILELRGTYKGGGGPEKTILLSAEKHRKDRFFLLVAYLCQPWDDEFQIDKMAENRGINFLKIFDRRFLDLKCIFELSALLKKHKISIVHAHDDKSSLYGLFLKILNPKVKIMYTCHLYKKYTIQDTNGFKGFLSEWFRRKVTLNIMRFYASPILAVSGATKTMLVEDGLASAHVQVILNTIDFHYWKKNREQSTFRSELKISDKSIVVGLVGRLGFDKDLPTFLHVAAEVLKKNPEVIFLLVGEGYTDEMDVLKRICMDLNIQKSVIFSGFRSDLVNVYSSFDLFLMTSTAEGLPNTVLEAMSMEVPVVSTAVDGVPELVVDGETGFLCEIKDLKSLSEKVCLLINNTDLREKFSKQGRNRIIERFSFDKRLEKIEEYYTTLHNS